TTSGFDGGGGACLSDINQDGFFQWTAPASADYTFDTNGTPWDTQINVHSGVGCAALCVDGDDDGGAFAQSLVQIPGVTAGESFLIQVGGYGTSAGVGTLSIGTYIDPCSNAPDDGFENNDTCAAAAAMGAGTHLGLFVSRTDPDFYSVSVPPGMILSVTLTAATFDVDFKVYGAGCSPQGYYFGNWGWADHTNAAVTLIFEVVIPAANSQACTDYDLEVEIYPDPCPAVPPDGFEDNDTCATATVLTAGSYTGLNVSASDEDFYSITIPTGMILEFVETQDSNRTIYDLWNSTCTTPLGFDAPWAYTYYNYTGAPETVVVVAQQDSSVPQQCSNYGFDVFFTPDPCASTPDDYLEDNDDCATALPLSDGMYPGLFVSKTDKDMYAICVPDGATLTCDVLHYVASGNLMALLWDASDASCGSGLAFTSELAMGHTNTDDEHLSWTNNTGRLWTRSLRSISGSSPREHAIPTILVITVRRLQEHRRDLLRSE
ncbi:MAG: hypothetical protein R3E96_16480, partial [Planctomycetota bacterium]